MTLQYCFGWLFVRAYDSESPSIASDASPINLTELCSALRATPGDTIRKRSLQVHSTLVDTDI